MIRSFEYYATIFIERSIKSDNFLIMFLFFIKGESNANQPNTYNCTFPSMIVSWRNTFYANSEMQTNNDFPFGFVQVCNFVYIELRIRIEGKSLGKLFYLVQKLSTSFARTNHWTE